MIESFMFCVGTQSTLLEKRPLDRSKIGLKKWFMDTVHLWAESPQGVWSIIFYDRVSHFY